jgi:hypothetical protein
MDKTDIQETAAAECTREQKLVFAALELQQRLIAAGIEGNSDFTERELDALIRVTKGDFQKVFARIKRLRQFRHEGY